MTMLQLMSITGDAFIKSHFVSGGVAHGAPPFVILATEREGVTFEVRV
jgi:hypothetical protein